MPEAHRNVSKRIQACNWLQNLEGEVDSSHANFLHAQPGPRSAADPQRRARRGPASGLRGPGDGLRPGDQRPPRRRARQVLLAHHAVHAAGVHDHPRARSAARYTFTGAVPCDDTNMIGITVTWNTGARRSRQRPFVDVDANYVPLQNKAQRLHDRPRGPEDGQSSPASRACASRTWRSRRTSAGPSRTARASTSAAPTRA